jgi:hypothetical protein
MDFIKRLFKKSTLIYIIIIMALAILFNNSKTKKNTINEGFNRIDKNRITDIKYINNEEGFTNEEDPIAKLEPIYEDEKQNYKQIFKNGEDLFNALVDLTDNSSVDDLIQPSVLADLAINIKTDIDTLINKIFTKFENINIADVDEYLENEYNNNLETVYNKYSKDYPQITNIIKKEINDLLLEKIDEFMANNSSGKNFKADTFEGFYSSSNNISNLSNNINSSINNIDEAEKNLELIRKMTYIRNMIAPSNEENEAEINKLLESFYNPTSTISQNKDTVQPSTPLSSNPTVTNPMNKIPKTYDGFTRSELEIIRRNQIANTPKNIDKVLIDPLKAVETVQEDLLGLLEKFNNKKKSQYLNRQFDPTNRGSYLVNSPNDDLVVNKINNLQNYSKSNNYSKKIISPKEEINKILTNKEYQNNIVEGFKNPSLSKKKQTSISTIMDGFIKYSSNNILNIINKLTSGTINIDSFDNNKMQSYGIIIIVLSILLFFISSTS